MRKSLLDGPRIVGPSVGVAVGMAVGVASHAQATTWTVSGASSNGVPVAVSSLDTGVLATGALTGPGAGNTAALSSAAYTALDNAVANGDIAALGVSFLGFENEFGQSFFGLSWDSRSNGQSATFTASVAGSNSGVFTNVSGATVSGGTITGAPGPDFVEYFLFSGLAADSTISIAGTVTPLAGGNIPISWLTYDGSDWVQAISPQVVSTGAFALNSVVVVPVPAPAALAAAGLAAGLLAARRVRKQAAERSAE